MTSLALISGCTTEQSINTSGKHFSPTSASSVKIYNSSKPSKSFEEIGRVSVSKYSNMGITRSGEEMNQQMKEQAAKIGGNAVISVSEDFANISGVVVRFN